MLKCFECCAAAATVASVDTAKRMDESRVKRKPDLVTDVRRDALMRSVMFVWLLPAGENPASTVLRAFEIRQLRKL